MPFLRPILGAFRCDFPCISGPELISGDRYLPDTASDPSATGALPNLGSTVEIADGSGRKHTVVRSPLFLLSDISLLLHFR